MLSTLAAADALIVRPIRAPAAAAGDKRSGAPPPALISLSAPIHAKLRGIAEHSVNM